MTNQEFLSNEQLVAVKDITDKLVVNGFNALLNAYLEINGEEFDEDDLIADIVEAGTALLESDMTFEDMIMIGVTAMGENLDVEFL